MVQLCDTITGIYEHCATDTVIKIRVPILHNCKVYLYRGTMLVDVVCSVYGNALRKRIWIRHGIGDGIVPLSAWYCVSHRILDIGET